MATQDENMQFYMTIRPDLVSKALGYWVLIADQQLVDVYASQEEALEVAVATYGTPQPGGVAPYLIKEVVDPEPVEIV